MNCEKMRDWMSLYIDNQLDDNEMKEFEKHLRECNQCTNDFSEMLDIMDEVHSFPQKEVPPDFHHNLMEQIVEIVEAENVPNKKRKKHLNTKFLSSMAAAALILFVVGGFSINGFLNQSKMIQDDTRAELGRSEQYTVQNQSVAKENAAPRFSSMTKEAPSVNRTALETKDTHNTLTVQFSEDTTVDVNQQSLSLKDDGNSDQGLTNQSQPKQLTKTSSSIDARKIIKSAEMNVEVENFDQVVHQVEFLTEQSGGYVESSNSSIYDSNPDRKEYLKEGYMVLRLPQNKYATTRQNISDLGHIVSQSENAVNVTQQYLETKSRINMLEVQEQRLLEIMKEADKVEDLIKLEERLNSIRTDLEIYKTDIQNWDQLVEYSTIRLSLRQVKKEEKIETVSPNFLTKVKENMIGSVNNTRNSVEAFVLKIARHSIELLFYGLGLLIGILILRPFFNKWLKIKNNK